MKKLIVILGIAFVVLEASDAFLTIWAVNHGCIEANPLMVPIAGTWLSPVVKVIPAALVAWGLARLGNRFPRIRPVVLFGLIAVTGFLGLVLGSNIVQL